MLLNTTVNIDQFRPDKVQIMVKLGQYKEEAWESELWLLIQQLFSSTLRLQFSICSSKQMRDDFLSDWSAR